MNWTLKYLPEAAKDFRNLAGNQRITVAKAIDKVLQNPLPVTEGGYGKPLGSRQGNDLSGLLPSGFPCLLPSGYGKPLGSRQGNDLSGLLKIKLRNAGIRVVYKLIRTESEMLVVVIGMRADDEVYDTAKRRAIKHDQ